MVTNAYFSIAWFRADVDLPKNFFYGKVLFFIQLRATIWCASCRKNLTCYLIKVVGSLKVFSFLLDLQMNEQKDCPPPPTLPFESTNKTKFCSKLRQCCSNNACARVVFQFFLNLFLFSDEKYVLKNYSSKSYAKHCNDLIGPFFVFTIGLLTYKC